jgi:hypothetical protein
MFRAHHVATASLALAVALASSGTASAASLLGQTITGVIQIKGDDDSGFYTLDVFNGAVDVGGGYSQSFNVFKQHTRGGFQGFSNQLSGLVTLNIDADTIAVNFTGQSQGVRLMSSFSGIAGPIETVAHATSGLVPGIMADEGVTYTASSVRFSLLMLGYEPSVNVTQLETLSFPAAPPNPVPEPRTWALLIGGLAATGAMLRRRRQPALASPG